MNPFGRQEAIQSPTLVLQNVTLKTYLSKVEIFWDFVWFKFSSPDMKIPFGSKIVDQCSYDYKYSNRIDCPNIIYSFKVTKMFKFLSRKWNLVVELGRISNDFPNDMPK